MAELLRRLGCTVDYDAAAGVVEIDVPQDIGHRADYDLVRALRASISVLGPLVARCGAADVAVPGGDAIGSRGLDLHAAGLEALGATVHVTHGFLVAEAPDGLHGAEIRLEFPQCRGHRERAHGGRPGPGRTRLENAAREPEIVDIAQMLSEMGARITGAGTSVIEVEGVRALTPVEHAVVPDRIARGPGPSRRPPRVATSRSSAGAQHLSAALELVKASGAEVTLTDRGFRVDSGGRRPKAVDVATLALPGLPDRPAAVRDHLQRRGRRLGHGHREPLRGALPHGEELNRLGAETRIDGHHVMVHGVERLSGAPSRPATSEPGGPGHRRARGRRGDHRQRRQHIDRGYAGFAESLRGLGATSAASQTRTSSSDPGFAPVGRWWLRQPLPDLDLHSAHHQRPVCVCVSE